MHRGTSPQHRVRLFRNPGLAGSRQAKNREECSLRECLVIYVDAALDKHGRAGCGLAVFVRGRAVYTESFGFSHLGGSAQLEAHVCAGALDLAAARWPYHRVIVRTDCAPVVRSRMPSSDSFRIAVHEVRERCRRGWRVVRYVSRKANPAHELAREGLKSLSKQQLLAAA
ncbi:MAG: ribonuclease H-like domain-containing protein [Chloroflexi bacterium]|nr:MAG: ribonuclease H-like domain-containing protein [Chloroflexota bacterium]TMF98062.1 MAG: ribonuclease H-like domain-containing protein [Chloroflexota bacterium]